MSKAQASCLCGAVKITAENINPKFTVCHCQTCRTWAGAPFFALQCGNSVTIEGNEHLTVFDSSAWASRGFCAVCGTHLFYQFNGNGAYNLSVGLFPSLPGLEMEMQYFSDLRPGYYCFSNETKVMTSAQIMARFAPTAEL